MVKKAPGCHSWGPQKLKLNMFNYNNVVCHQARSG